MIQVNFSQVVNKAEKEKCKFAVIVSRYNGQWVFCRHKDRTTYECPGGHREVQEDILDTAQLLQKIEGEEEVEKMDALLSLAITGGDCNWI